MTNLKVDFTSDLHLDFWIKELNRGLKLEGQIKQFSKQLELFGGEVLIIAGDLGHYYVQDSAFLKYMKKLYKEVIVVYGNHDLYLISKNLKSKYKCDSMLRIKEMKEFCKSEGIHYLDGDTIEINGITFGGVGMSWDKTFLEKLRGYPVTDGDAERLFNRTMNDGRNIYSGRDHLKINNLYSNDIVYSSFKPFEFFESELKKLQSIEHADVMISHYGPAISPDLFPGYKEDEITTFFYFDGSNEIKRIKPKFWVHGHTHKYYNFNKHNCNILCSPLGYPRENSYITVDSFTI